MAGKALDAGKEFLAGVLAKLPESVRGQVETAFNDPQAADALVAIGSGALAQSDINRKYQEIQTKQAELDAAIATAQEDYQKNVDWYKTTSAELETLRAAARGHTPPPPAPPPAAPTGLSREDIDKILAERDQGYAGVLGLATTLAAQHLKNFGEVLDGNELINFAKEKRLPLAEAYKQKFSEQITAKAQAEEKARIDKLVEERLQAERRNHQQPFPIRSQEPSVLDVLEAKERPATPDPYDFYQSLQAGRQA